MKRRPPGRNGGAPPTIMKVGIYTRQSIADDLEFNSIEAQRQAVEAFVQSQPSWEVLPTRYDDCGFTGGNTERPAFRQLLMDVRERKLDIVAVHKVDRMSRSVFDLQGVLRELEEHDVAFVATTQQINTTGSAGKLVLNLLAAVAEFERDMIRERTRDKALATRRRGMWTGGFAPLGYDAVDKKLVINEAEAEQVRGIFRLFIETGGSVIQVVEELDARGLRMKPYPSNGNGKETDPRPFTATSLKRLLMNPTYAAKVVLEGKEYAGANEAIVDQATWDAVQRLISDRRPERSRRRSKSEALLQGLVRCGACGSAMTARYSQKKGRKYWYYSCLRLIKHGAAACPGSHVPARVLEAKVVEQIRAIGREPALLDEVVRQMEREREEKRPELEARLTEVAAERERLERETRSLSTAVAEATTGRRPLHERLGEVYAALEAKDGEEARLRAELEALDGQAVDREALRSSLEEFDAIWEELFPAERGRMLGLLVEGVEYEARVGAVALKFRVEAPTA